MTTPESEEVSSQSPVSSGTAAPATPEEVVETPATDNNLRRVVSIQDQRSRIPRKKIFIVMLSLMCSIFLSSFEQVSVSTTLPGIARDFGTSTAIAWVGTAF